MMSREYLPLHLWIDFRLAGERKGTISLFTTGMAAFGHMEIEIWESHEKPRDVYDIGVNIAHYLLDRGPVLKDGQTIGMSPEQRLRIRLLPSRWDRPGNVISIEV